MDGVIPLPSQQFHRALVAIAWAGANARVVPVPFALRLEPLRWFPLAFHLRLGFPMLSRPVIYPPLGKLLGYRDVPVNKPVYFEMFYSRD